MRRGSEVSAAVLALLLLSAAVPPVAGLAGPDERAPNAIRTPESAQRVGGIPAAQDASNNSTRHANPANGSRDGNLDDLQGWFAGRMADQLTESSLELSQGEYELARSLLGDEFDRNLERYVDVAGQTDTPRDDETAETLNETRTAQETFVSSVRRYRNLSEEYEAARRDGNTERARTLARQLARIENRTSASRETVVANYGTIANATDRNFSEATAVVTNVSRNVSTRQTEIEAETFAETRLAATPRSNRVSFLDPLRVDGRLTTANGSAVANESIRVRISGRTIRTTTNASGEFAVSYRPTTLPTGEQSIRIEYVPANTSAYLGSNATVAANVSQVAPVLRVENSSDSGGFDREVTVAGTVGAENVAAAGVPVVARLGGQRVGQARTGPNGRFSLDASVPATVPPGERRVRLTLPLDGRALASTDASANVMIRETPSELTIAGERASSTEVRISGTLASAAGRPVAGQRVQFRIDGTVVGAASTRSDGAYATTLDVPSELVPGDGTASIDVTAVYAARGTNLEPARASTVVELAANGGSSSAAGEGGLFDEAATSPWKFALLGLFGLVALVAAGLLYARWRASDGSAPDAEAAGGDDGPTDAGEPDSADGSADAGAPLLDLARSQLAAGESNAAAETAYAAVRQRLRDSVDAEPELTHWEFLVAYRDAESTADLVEELQRLTRTYERAAFTGEQLAADVAESAVETAATLGAASGQKARGD